MAATPAATGNAEPARSTTAGGGGSGRAWLVTKLILGLLLLGSGAYVTWTRILVPRRRDRAYRDAVRAVSEGRYAQALPELSRLEGVLPPERQRDARLFIAFALFQLDELEEAEVRLAAMHRESPTDRDVGYLLAYLRVRRQDYDDAEPVISALGEDVVSRAGNLRKLYGVVEFHRAMKAFREGRIDAAADLFQTVERLGDFRQHIPADLRNRHVMLGTQALFDKDVVEARGQFERLEQSAADIGDPAVRDDMLATAKLGLALALWVENSPHPATVETLLVEAARLLDPDGATSLAWPDEAGEPADQLADRLATMADEPAPLDDADRVLRDIHLVRAAAMLRSWAADRSADASAYLADTLSRLACSRERDREFSDTLLVAGLLRYHLAGDDADRRGGLGLLREAQKLGVRDPEVLRVLEEDKRSRRATRDAVEAYLQVLDEYVRDNTVREQVRLALRERLSRFGKVGDLDRRPGIIRIRAVQPTVAEMNDRSQMLTERVRQLLAMYPEAGELAGAHELIRILDETGKALSDHARSVEETEARLLALVGDRLLSGQ